MSGHRKALKQWISTTFSIPERSIKSFASITSHLETLAKIYDVKLNDDDDEKTKIQQIKDAHEKKKDVDDVALIKNKLLETTIMKEPLKTIDIETGQEIKKDVDDGKTKIDKFNDLMTKLPQKIRDKIIQVYQNIYGTVNLLENKEQENVTPQEIKEKRKLLEQAMDDIRIEIKDEPNSDVLLPYFNDIHSIIFQQIDTQLEQLPEKEMEKEQKIEPQKEMEKEEEKQLPADLTSYLLSLPISILPSLFSSIFPSKKFGSDERKAILGPMAFVSYLIKNGIPYKQIVDGLKDMKEDEDPRQLEPKPKPFEPKKTKPFKPDPDDEKGKIVKRQPRTTDQIEEGKINRILKIMKENPKFTAVAGSGLLYQMMGPEYKKILELIGIGTTDIGERHAMTISDETKERVVSNFIGPFTNVDEKIARGIRPVNELDRIAYIHDLRYSSADDYTDIANADDEMLENLWRQPPSDLRDGMISAIKFKKMIDRVYNIYPLKLEKDEQKKAKYKALLEKEVPPEKTPQQLEVQKTTTETKPPEIQPPETAVQVNMGQPSLIPNLINITPSVTPEVPAIAPPQPEVPAIAPPETQPPTVIPEIKETEKPTTMKIPLDIIDIKTKPPTDIIMSSAEIEEEPIEFEVKKQTVIQQSINDRGVGILKPKFIVPSVDVVTKSDQEQYVDDIEFAMFDFVQDDSGGLDPDGTNYLLKDQSISLGIRYNKAGVNINSEFGQDLPDQPSKINNEFLKEGFLGEKIPEMKFLFSNEFEAQEFNLSEFETKTYDVNNERVAIQYKSPYADFTDNQLMDQFIDTSVLYGLVL